MTSQTKDMTRGNTVKLLLSFAVPMMLGNLFQQFYTITDAAIVGQFAGVDALTAIGSTDWLSWMLFGLVTGLMQGFSIRLSQRFGEGDKQALLLSTSTSIILGIGATVLFTIIGLIFARPVLQLMSTQSRVFESACDYLTIIYGGMIITGLYNLLACILRAFGNSRVPLIAMVAASIGNIVLDLLFVAVFHWGVSGAAVATIMAQGIAAVICLISVLRLDVLKYKKGEFKFDLKEAKTLILLAAPMGFQNIVISVGGVVLQSVVNNQDYAFVAGYNASGKFFGLLEAAAVSYGYAITTFTGQNYGAKLFARIRECVKKSIGISVLLSLATTGIVLMCGKWMLRLFLEASTEKAITDIALNCLRIDACGLFGLYLMYVFRSALQGLGDTVVPMFAGVLELVCRVTFANLLSKFFGSSGLYYVEPITWLAAAILVCIVYYRKQSSFPKNINE